eukprot:CAMPEP_0182926030 /NCGR_PEP_ID=MMETSP0105_2-20130417/10789_1 /TAXON_ID=81532 ORGANISM="Acanthoeca-like sp., Strain 10tr" /NCGR_SAMPLE_ID=MMETSP0105_2 /ASSEMBLY_ACC=CAM_ASM_000205 /LENGTH=314 /DNA_ID=CAMNT_0025063903 /DNA_START=55 /DNA_END=999 /DNA_ORIENTATION=-
MSFPLLNIYRVIKLEATADWDAPITDSAKGAWYLELLARHVRLSTYVFLALFYHYTFDMDWAKTLSPGWIAWVFARNYLVMVAMYGGWHWFLFESAYAAVMKTKKFNAKMPSGEQMFRDRLFTTLGFTQSSVWEVTMLHAWASGSEWVKPYYTDFWAYPLWSIFQVLLIGYWRDGHFYWIHRFMHPWKTTIIPDVGQFMYDHVHSLHHKSYITAPWSGLAMHPVEHLFYYSCTLLPMVWSLHPFHFWMNKIHADISPLPGHDGHDSPAGGSYFHHIHHAKYEYNYGTPMVPFDKLFGTYQDGSKWEKEGVKKKN